MGISEAFNWGERVSHADGYGKVVFREMPSAAVDLPDQSSSHSPWQAYQQPLAMPFKLPTPIFGAMLAIWHLRPGLRRRFPLAKGNPADYIRFLAWCVAEGRAQYAILRELPDWDVALSMPVELPKVRGDIWDGVYSVGMFLFGVSRFRYSLVPLLGNARSRNFVARTYWREARRRCFLATVPAWQSVALAKRFGSSQLFLDAIKYRGKDKDKTELELADAYQVEDVLTMLRSVPVGASTPLPVKLAVPLSAKSVLGRIPYPFWRRLMALRDRMRRHPSESDIGAVMKQIPVLRKSQPGALSGEFGVNLFGYATGELGIGEDVRMVSQALHKAGIPFCIVNVLPGKDVSQQDESAAHWLTQSPRYSINLFCMTGIEQVRYICERGVDCLAGRYTIGLWPWELPRWPESWQHAYNLVHELWGISSYTSNAYASAPVPVATVPLAVHIENVAEMSRRDFGLAEDRYLFVFSFDLNSTVARKNPDAVVDAFQMAFPLGLDDVGLVLKVSHADADNRAWRRLLKRITKDPRIHVVSKVMRRPEVLALYRCCDCYVSLHRAEGFGRGIAEALLLGMEVICTNFSGNRDYCLPERVKLVRYRERAVRPGEYFFSDGQAWAEPSVDHAAQLMREVVMSPCSTIHPGFDHSPAAAGDAYKQQLQRLKQLLSMQEASLC